MKAAVRILYFLECDFALAYCEGCFYRPVGDCREEEKLRDCDGRRTMGE